MHAYRPSPKVSYAVDFRSYLPQKLSGDENIDLITACDCIHDFAAPERTLEQIRVLLKPEGTLFIIEPKAVDRLEDNPIGTMLYGFSIFHCMAQSLAKGGPDFGTCLGPTRTEELVRAARFQHLQELDIKSPTNLFYGGRP